MNIPPVWKDWKEEKRYENLAKAFSDFEKVKSLVGFGLVEDVIKVKVEEAFENFEQECIFRFQAMLDELQKSGYKEVWVGPNPFSDKMYWNSMIFATPRRRRELLFDSLSLSRITRKYFPMACANGLAECDQFQTQFDLPKSLVGRHIL